MITNQIRGNKINTPDKPANFNYNTTIVALNPFKKEIFDDIHPDSSISSRSSSGNDTNLNKLLNQRKFLINKNIRFYEPVKDAEIIAQMHFLRSKLHSTELAKPKKTANKENEIKTSSTTPVKRDTDTFVKSKSRMMSKSALGRNDTQENEDVDFNKLKQEIKQRTEINLKDDNEEFPGLKRFSQLRKKKSDNSLKISQSFKARPKQSSESLSPTRTSLPDINNQNKFMLHNNFNHVLRKSRKYRLNNIYKPIEYVHSVEHNFKKRSGDETTPKPNTASSHMLAGNFTTSTVYEESMEKNDFNKINNFKNSSKDMSGCCQDPNCDFKNMFESNSSNFHVKKEFPNERFQRIKNNEVKIIQNIISDIPNTLTTMSTVGTVTNFEKLLANKLSEFYTEKTRYVK